MNLPLHKGDPSKLPNKGYCSELDFEQVAMIKFRY